MLYRNCISIKLGEKIMGVASKDTQLTSDIFRILGNADHLQRTNFYLNGTWSHV